MQCQDNVTKNTTGIDLKIPYATHNCDFNKLFDLCKPIHVSVKKIIITYSSGPPRFQMRTVCKTFSKQ